MSIACCLPVVECVYCLACARWVWQRCLHSGGYDSETWGVAMAEEFEPVPRLCRIILSVYEDDLENPQWAPPGGYGMEPRWVVHRRSYENTHGHAPTYLLYVDHQHSDVVLAARGMDMLKESDYAVLLDNKLGQRRFDGGYVHNGLLKAAEWVFDAECDVLKDLLERNPGYTLTFAGHSLGSGVVSMLALLAVHNRELLGGIDRKRIRCFAMAPARCMSLNLAVRYADVINAVILQDDFLPRTDIPLEDIFKSLFCLPCLLCGRCLIDTCIPESVMLRDPRRLYAPGRLYHIVERKPFRCGRYPPLVRTAVPVDGRFERIVLSCNATSDHAIIWIEREAQRALDLLLENEKTMQAPEVQRMSDEITVTRDHDKEQQEALRRAITLGVADIKMPSAYGTFDENPTEAAEAPLLSDSGRRRAVWEEWIARIFEKDESGQMVPRR
uniref:Alpha/beta-hydrolase n=1 Tax=Saccharum hybrid cultivar SP80-3280 TaxID=193079 RepID=A0A2R4QNS9_9POAL|nr:alpha/beta-hydrolase [Saccharum hybrid cultivar SP80-3280]